tara:strand:- start:4964 stop:8212 length:3249 start_codon:yes stop_codon:yes gene_type:complete
MEERYKKMSQREHVYELPDSYVGSTEKTSITTYVAPGVDRLEKKEIVYVPALFKIFDEVLVNAIDQYTRTQKKSLPVSRIEIYVDVDSISVKNNGKGIPIKKLPEYGNVLVPEMIFGELLTSSNYDKNQEKTTGGKNGFGAKLANIFSKLFCVETVCGKKKFKQTFLENMKIKEPPVISTVDPGQDGTSIYFEPDLERFGISKISKDEIDLFRRRALDTAAWTDGTVKVFFNGEELKCKDFKSYADMKSNASVVHALINKNWEIAATTNNDEVFSQTSFVNGINTTRGGTHVNAITSQICDAVASILAKKHKQNIKPVYVKNQLNVFVKSTIINPAFDSQTKDTLTTAAPKFGSKYSIPTRFIKDLLAQTNLEDRVIQMVEYKDGKALKKTDGKKTSKIKGIPKLVDANKAGGKLSKKCVLILTEGDSAKTMAVAGLSVVGRDYYGVFPLRGKLMNVKDMSAQKIADNVEISNMKKIIGLKDRIDYSNSGDPWPLRYGKIIIMTDQDVDGSHIKGLLISLFHTTWKSLLKQGFVTSLITPIIKVFPKKKKTSGEKSFFTLSAYEDWKKSTNNASAYRVKYYKGLGTSTTSEAKEYFRDMKIVEYTWEDQSDDSITLAFSKNRANDRKQWLSKYDAKVCLTGDETKVSMSEFINKDLIHFSMYNVHRSIPSVMDGLKPSQRKILWSGFKRKMYSEVKVAQLAGYVSEHAAYHHGEVSLQDTIVGMAQDFVGSNNLNLLLPNGTFGSRLQGGKDAASARYIFTELAPYARTLFPEDDDSLLEFNTDDGNTIEPVNYIPLIPLVLVNGANGIATGYSTTVPMYNPLDIIQVMRAKLTNESETPLKPWFRGFEGIVKSDSKTYTTIGTYNQLNPDVIKITELPIGVWTEKYREYLDKLVEKKILKNYVDHSTESKVNITLKFVKPPTDLDTVLRLEVKKNITNMHLLNSNQIIKKYNSPREICDEFFAVRLDLYSKRKALLQKKLTHQLLVMRNKMRFIKAALTVDRFLAQSSTFIVDFLETNKFDKVNDDWVYLTDMKVSALNKNNCKALQEKIKKFDIELKLIESTSEKTMYLRDLEELKKKLV